MWYLWAVEYYTAIKKDTLMPYAATWMEVDGIILSELSHKEKENYWVVSFTCGI